MRWVAGLNPTVWTRRWLSSRNVRSDCSSSLTLLVRQIRERLCLLWRHGYRALSQSRGNTCFVVFFSTTDCTQYTFIHNSEQEKTMTRTAAEQIPPDCDALRAPPNYCALERGWLHRRSPFLWKQRLLLPTLALNFQLTHTHKCDWTNTQPAYFNQSSTSQHEQREHTLTE